MEAIPLVVAMEPQTGVAVAVVAAFQSLVMLLVAPAAPAS
jgi:hypothetical protein